MLQLEHLLVVNMYILGVAFFELEGLGSFKIYSNISFFLGLYNDIL